MDGCHLEAATWEACDGCLGGVEVRAGRELCQCEACGKGLECPGFQDGGVGFVEVCPHFVGIGGRCPLFLTACESENFVALRSQVDGRDFCPARCVAVEGEQQFLAFAAHRDDECFVHSLKSVCRGCQVEHGRELDHDFPRFVEQCAVDGGQVGFTLGDEHRLAPMRVAPGWVEVYHVNRLAAGQVFGGLGIDNGDVVAVEERLVVLHDAAQRGVALDVGGGVKPP